MVNQHYLNHELKTFMNNLPKNDSQYNVLLKFINNLEKAKSDKAFRLAILPVAQIIIQKNDVPKKLIEALTVETAYVKVTNSSKNNQNVSMLANAVLEYRHDRNYKKWQRAYTTYYYGKHSSATVRNFKEVFACNPSGTKSMTKRIFIAAAVVSLSLAALRQMCKKNKLPAYGNKTTLVLRLMKNHKKKLAVFVTTGVIATYVIYLNRKNINS